MNQQENRLAERIREFNTAAKQEAECRAPDEPRRKAEAEQKQQASRERGRQWAESAPLNLLHELEEIEKMVNGENSLAGCLIRKEFVRQNVPRGEDRDSFIGGALELYQAAKLIA